MQSELQTAYLQEFITTVRDKCFDKCITKPSSSLGSSEQQCLARCCDRYAEVCASHSLLLACQKYLKVHLARCAVHSSVLRANQCCLLACIM